MSSNEDVLKGSARDPAFLNSGSDPWKPEIAEAIYGFLYRDDLGVDPLVAALHELEDREGLVVYVELLYLLTDIRFEPEQAQKHWKAVIRHRQELEDAVGYGMDLSVALVSYFVQVSPKMKHPKVIELKLFEETRDSAYKRRPHGSSQFSIFPGIPSMGG